MGTAHYLTTSEGEKVENPRWYRKAEGLLRKHQKTQSRRQKGSHRWQKAVHASALHQERTTNKRKDFIGKLVYKLYHHYQNTVLVAEALSISNMVKNKHLSKSISDASWATFFKWCADMVSERDGLHFHQVDPKNTSQICSCCGQKAPKKLSLSVRTFIVKPTINFTLARLGNLASERVYSRNCCYLKCKHIFGFYYNCGYCGNAMDRDHNAAQNILFRAATALRGERWVATLCEARNKNEARDAGLQGATQLTLFNALTSPSL